MLLEGPQQTTGLIGQTWKTGNGRSRLVLTGQHKHTPPPPPPHQGNQGGGGTTRGTPPPPHQGGTPHRAQPRVHYADHHQPTPHPRTNGGGGPVRPQPPTTPQSNTPQRATPARAPHTPPHVSVVIAGRQRPDPSRTRKLRPPAPMVLRPPGRGRAGHHRAHTTPPHHPHKTTAGGKQTTTRRTL